MSSGVTKTGNQKYNWSELKLEYFGSGLGAVRVFLGSKWVPINWNSKKMTVGWGEEKKTFRAKIWSKMKRESEKKVVKSMSDVMLKLRQWEIAMLREFADRTTCKCSELTVQELIAYMAQYRLLFWNPAEWQENIVQDTNPVWARLEAMKAEREMRD